MSHKFTHDDTAMGPRGPDVTQSHVLASLNTTCHPTREEGVTQTGRICRRTHRALPETQCLLAWRTNGLTCMQVRTTQLCMRMHVQGRDEPQAHTWRQAHENAGTVPALGHAAEVGEPIFHHEHHEEVQNQSRRGPCPVSKGPRAAQVQWKQACQEHVSCEYRVNDKKDKQHPRGPHLGPQGGDN